MWAPPVITSSQAREVVLVDPRVGRERVEERRRHRDVGHAVRRDELQQGLEDRAGKGDDARAHAQRCGEHEHEADGVEERRRGEDDGSLVEGAGGAEGRRPLLGARGEVAVGEAHALGQAAGAARERHGGEVLGIRRAGSAYGSPALERQQRLDRRRVAGRRRRGPRDRRRAGPRSRALRERSGRRGRRRSPPVARHARGRAPTRRPSTAGSRGEIAAPARHTPSATTGHHARLGMATEMRSPGRTPPARSPAARAAERAASSPRVSVSPVAPSTTATASGSAAAWRRKAVATAGSPTAAPVAGCDGWAR